MHAYNEDGVQGRRHRQIWRDKEQWTIGSICLPRFASVIEHRAISRVVTAAKSQDRQKRTSFLLAPPGRNRVFIM